MEALTLRRNVEKHVRGRSARRDFIARRIFADQMASRKNGAPPTCVLRRRDEFQISRAAFVSVSSENESVPGKAAVGRKSSSASSSEADGSTLEIEGQHVKCMHRFPSRPNTRPSGETTGRWDVHRYGTAPHPDCLETVVASRSASPLTSPAARRRSSRATIAAIHRLDAANCDPVSLEDFGSLVAGSKRCASCPPGVQPREGFERHAFASASRFRAAS
jgi:hypothetical protein